MREIVEKGVLMGWGVLSLTRERAQTIIDDLVKRGEARKEDVHELVDRLAAQGEKEREALRNLVRDEITAVLDKANLPTKKDLAAIEKKIDKLLKS